MSNDKTNSDFAKQQLTRKIENKLQILQDVHFNKPCTFEQSINDPGPSLEDRQLAAREIAKEYLEPCFSAMAHQRHLVDIKRLQTLEDRKNDLQLALSSEFKLSWTQTSKLLEQVVNPPVEGENWDMSDFNLEDIRIEWVCRGLAMAPGDSMAMVADPYAGKTHLAAYIALCVMSGKPIFGKFDIQNPGKVVHLNYDSSSILTKIAYNRLGRGLGFQPKDQLFYVGQDKLNWKFHHECAEVNLTRLCTGRKLCIVDSLRMCYDGDEDQSSVSDILGKANRVSEATGCIILFIAHPGKDGAGKGLYAMRGSSAQVGAVGALWNLTKEGERTLELSCSKSRNGEFATFQYSYADKGDFLENINKSARIEMSWVGGVEPAGSMRDKFIKTLKDNTKLNSKALSDAVGGNDAERGEVKKSLISEKIIIEFHQTKDGQELTRAEFEAAEKLTGKAKRTDIDYKTKWYKLATESWVAIKTSDLTGANNE